ncbi:hypothetical protein, partial [Arenimonas sp.]|uniref:hypothetical protein n=1 Tax=Arenimonas sp. TaxID=1872635 RepID=UPI0025D82B45
MSRAGKAFGVGAVVVFAGAVRAATGVLPNPFAPPPPDVVEAGSPEARAAGEMTMPAPASAS